MPQFGRPAAKPALEQKKAEQAVVRALTDSLPDFWMRAELVLELPDVAPGKISMRHTVKSGEGHQLSQPPPEPFFLALQPLVQSFANRGKRLKKMTFYLQRQPDRSWTFHTQTEIY